MKKIISWLLLIATALTLTSCNKTTYPAVESSKKESQVLMKIGSGKKSYEVRYELYRAFYLTLREDYGETLSAEQEDELEARVLDNIYNVYATFALCEEYGINLYSRAVEEQIDSFIRVSVEGGLLDSTEIEGFSSYEEYLASLRELYLNYSVQILLFRYTIGMTAIEAHYPEVDGIQQNVTKDEVRAFYDLEDTHRYLTLYLSADYCTEERAAEIRNTIATLNSESAVANKMINHSASLAAEEILNGRIITPYNLDDLLYGDLTKAAAALAVGETSAPIAIYNSQNRGYFILYRTEKSDEHFRRAFNTIAREYINDKIGRDLARVNEELRAHTTFFVAYDSLDRASISMED